MFGKLNNRQAVNNKMLKHEYGIFHIKKTTLDQTDPANQQDFLITFFSGPLVGKYLSIWGVKAIFPAGFIIDGGTFIMFGMLQWVNDTTMFLLFSYLIRFLEVFLISKCFDTFKDNTNHYPIPTDVNLGSRSGCNMDLQPLNTDGQVSREKVHSEGLV